MKDTNSLNSSPLISVLTPSWNRANYLQRVWDGLNSQTFRDFEWIVSDDGSTDDTQEVINRLAERSDFPIVLVTASEHIGKIRMDNEAVKLARGDFIVWNDSDDYFKPEAFERFLTAWNSINEAERNQFVAVTALCEDEFGLTSSKLPYESDFDTTWNDLYEKYLVQGDMSYFIRADMLKQCPFPEVDFVIPEGVVWTELGNHLTRLITLPLLVKQYRVINNISFSGIMNYCRGYAYSMAVTERNSKKYKRKLSRILWRMITYIRLSIHGDVKLSNQLHQWADNSSKLMFFMVWPVAWLLAIKDRIQRKVVKSHIAFDIANKSVKINHKILR